VKAINSEKAYFLTHKIVRKVWPQATLQYDYFHVMQWLWKYLKNALLQYRRSLQGERWVFHRKELWEMEWDRSNIWTVKPKKNICPSLR
jgi:hypothetical protein